MSTNPAMRARPVSHFLDPMVRWAVLALGLLAGGCMVGPNFQRPAAQAPKAWLGATTATMAAHAGAPGVELERWWRAFKDPELDALIERGVRSNLDLQLARQRILQARAVVGESASGLWPSLDFSGQYQRQHTRLPEPSTPTPGFQRSTTQNFYQAGFDSLWELDLFGGVRRGVEASRADLRASEQSLRDTLVTVCGEIGVDYLNLRGLQSQLKITRRNLQTQVHTVEIARKRHDVGFAAALDVYNAEAQAESTRAQIPALEASIRQTMYQLSLLLGEEPGALLKELSPERPLPAIPMQIPSGLPSELLQRRPDIRRAEEQLHAATARIGVAVADLFPKFSLTGATGAQANTLTSWNKSVTSSWALGPTVSWNLFSGGLFWNRVKENRALAEQALTTYRQTVLNAFQEVESAWIAFDRETERGRSLAIAVDRNRHAVGLSNQLYVEGQTEFLTVLVAQQALLATENALAQSRNAAADDLVTVYKALGGGWQNWPGAIVTPPHK